LIRNRNNRITDPDPDPQHRTLNKAFTQEKVGRVLLTVILAATAVTAKTSQATAAAAIAATTAATTAAATRLLAMFAPLQTVMLIS
jgi:hypothetical protein